MEIREPSDQFKLAWAILKGDKVSRILGAPDVEARRKLARPSLSQA